MTLVTCTIPEHDLAAVWKEAKRVLRPGGRMYIMHHNLGRWANDRSPGILWEWLTLAPILAIMDCHINRDIEPSIRRVFPQTTNTKVDLPTHWRLMQPHHFIEAVK